MASNSSLISPREAHLPVTQLFTKKEIIGKGAYGAVYKATHNSTGTAVAIKVIELDSPESAEEDISEIQREVALLSSLRDAERNNCTSYHGCWLMSTQLWLAMDLAAGGSIRTIMKSTTLEEKFVAVIMRETLVALVYLHKQGIIHRDIKAANVLLTSSGRIVLCDFGVAAHLQHGNNKRSTFTGTPYWMAPEVIADGKLYDTKADIWSLGVTCFECATGNPPYAQYEALRAIQLIPKNPPAKLDPNGVWSPAMREFLAGCLNEDPQERSSAEDLQKTKWIKSHAKTPVSVLKDLIIKYDTWLRGGGIRNSIIGIEDSSLSDDGWAAEGGWDYDSPMPDHGEPAYGGSNLGTDGPAYPAQTRPQLSSRPSTNANHPLLRLFEQEETPGPLVSAAAAANAYGLGLGLNGPPGPSEPASKPHIAIPDFGGDSDEDDSSSPAAAGAVDAHFNTNTMRGPSQRTHTPLSEASTVRGRPQLTPLPSSFSAASGGGGGSSSSSGNSGAGFSNTPSYSRPLMSPSPKLSNLNLAKKAETPLPASPSVSATTTPIEGRMPFGMHAGVTASPPKVARSRSNTLQHQSSEEEKALPANNNNNNNTALTSGSPPKTVRPAPRREGTGASSGSEAASSISKMARGPHASTKQTTPPPAAPIAAPAPTVPFKPSLQPWSDGPAIRPLDYARLGNTSAEVHVDLERTVSDLSAWLAQIDGSLTNLLDSTAAA